MPGLGSGARTSSWPAPAPAASPFADSMLQAAGGPGAWGSRPCPDPTQEPLGQGRAAVACAAASWQLPRSPFQLFSPGSGGGAWGEQPAAAGGSTPLASPFAGAVQGVAGPGAVNADLSPNPFRFSAGTWLGQPPAGGRAAFRRLGSNMSCEYGGWASPQASKRKVAHAGASLGSMGSGPCDMETLSSTVRQLSMRGSSCDLDRGA